MITMETIFQNLHIEPKGNTVYFHIHSDKLKPLITIKELFSVIDRYFDSKSTISMPSFPFTGADYHEYLQQSPVFDVVQTPSRVNLICQIFRRKENVIRSLHPWLSVASKGYLAKEFVAEHHCDYKVFSDRSPFGKMLMADGMVIGLGVDCNTNSFAHIPDDRMLQHYSFNVYEENNRIYPCLDYDRKRILVETNLFEKYIGKKIKPRKMKPIYQKQSFYKEYVVDGIEFYSLKLKEFVAFTVEYNREIVKKEGKPLYYA
jgi:aminoglycoside N3'-acetyltransferase